MTNECVDKIEKLIWENIYKHTRQISEIILRKNEQNIKIYQKNHIKCDINWIDNIYKEFNTDSIKSANILAHFLGEDNMEVIQELLLTITDRQLEKLVMIRPLELKELFDVKGKDII